MHVQQVPAQIHLHRVEALPRTAGVHVSGLIRNMAVEIGILDRKWVPEDFDLLSIAETPGNEQEWWNSLDQDSKVRMSIGMAWEHWYLPRIPDMDYQPGELCLDGIYLTVDGQSLDVLMTERNTKGYRLAVHEIKTTSKSLNTVATSTGPLDPDGWEFQGASLKNWMWLMQTKAYAKATNTRVVYLHVLFLFGDYSYPMRPRLIVWRIEFEQAEIDEAWELLLENYQRYKSEGRI